MSNEGTTRIEIDNELLAKLDKIKSKNYVSGKGHGGTIAYLVRHYEQTGEIENMLESKFAEIPGLIEKGISQALKNFFKRLLGGE